MDKEKAINLIKKLMVRTPENGATQSEAEAAIAETQRLLIKYQLSLAEVQATAEPHAYREQEIHDRRREYSVPFILSLVEPYYFVESLYRGDRVCLFGDPHHVEIARHVFHFLRRTYRECWSRIRQERNLPRREMRAYYMGLTESLRRRLEDERKKFAVHQQNALTVASHEVAKAFTRQYGDLPAVSRTPVQGRQSTFERGKADGEKIQIRDAVTHKSGRAKTLIAS